MKAAVVLQAGQTPVYQEFQQPVPQAGVKRVSVTAAALSQLTRSRASGLHYSSATQYPFVPGVDGTGRFDDGRRVYFFMPIAPFGSMAEQTLVAEQQCVLLPDDLDDITAAAIVNPAMSSWAAMTARAQLAAGETVLINGATGTSGKLAVQIARFLGAKKVIATGRNPASLQLLTSIGADAVISLTDDEQTLQEVFRQHFSAGVDVVVDYLWGDSAQLLLKAAAASAGTGVALRFVQVGAMGGKEITLPAAVLRSKAITLMGSGLGSITNDRLMDVMRQVLDATRPGGFNIATRAIPLSDVEQGWSLADGSRTVFTL
ncbi:quinone oxidoreductase family protein [Biostraticola tofi]|uniref:NADPH:quinone reductase-like Zn-dependent oxidoreductase n=1 Tax=Biostraticola tofi TaxID=466109 RepID=A0A4V2W5B5_9GAMM|nr:zinc-binding alcohol dehydrogenase family protein [Biostraticola tofi]TCV98934.1 NADPH:quinone reductase-like Zn-dependent oxidoreductase [Biostraticola tofi]